MEDLIPLLLLAAYYLLAARRRAKQKKLEAQRETAPQEALVSEDGAAQPTPFQSFLEELEAAVAEANGIDREDDDAVEAPEVARTPTPAPVPPSPVVATPLPSLGSGEFQAPPGSFDASHPVDHEAHGFGLENPLSEEAFEESPVFSPRKARERRAFDPHGLRPAPPASTAGAAAATGVESWHRRLADPRTAREAFVLQTVFGPRGGRRGERRGR